MAVFTGQQKTVVLFVQAPQAAMSINSGAICLRLDFRSCPIFAVR